MDVMVGNDERFVVSFWNLWGVVGLMILSIFLLWFELSHYHGWLPCDLVVVLASSLFVISYLGGINTVVRINRM